MVAIQGAKVAAMSAISGFKDGGAIPRGERLIRVNEDGQEGVLNARGFALYGKYLNSMNNGTFNPNLLNNYTIQMNDNKELSNRMLSVETEIKNLNKNMGMYTKAAAAGSYKKLDVNAKTPAVNVTIKNNSWR